MNRPIRALATLLLALSPAALWADSIVAFGFITTTPDDGYAIQAAGDSLALIEQVRGINVVLHRFAKVPEPTAEAVTAILARYRDTKDIVVQRAQAHQQHGTRGVYAEGTATIAGVESRFWFISTGVENRAVLAVAHAPADVNAFSVIEIEAILNSIRPDWLHFDFQTPGLSNQWNIQGKITVERAMPPEPYEVPATNDEAEADDSAPRSHAVRLQATGQGVFFTRPNRVPRDWTSFESVSFWLFRDGQAEAPTTIELQALEDNGPKRYWRKIVVDHDGWKRYVVPLRWMRRSNEGVPSWERIGRLALWFRDAGDVWVDSIVIEDLDPQAGATLAPDDVASIVVPAAKDKARIATTDIVTIVSGAPGLDVDQLAGHLELVNQAMAADLSFLTLKDDDHGPFLVIAPTRDAYRKFVTDFVTALNSQIAPPASDGFTFHGVAASYWDPQQGTLRPVYTHEYVHAALAEAMRIDNQGEWLHEGLGTYYQMKFHPQANLKQIVQQGLQAPDYMTPLPRLCNGEAISNRRYWQAMTLVELLLSEPKYRQQLPQLIEALRNSKSTNLEPHLKPVLKTDWAQLTDDWRKHCQKHYAVAEPANAADAN